MMKQLTVRRISGDVHFATQVAAVFQEQGIETHQVDVLNWEAYSYAPQVQFQIAHDNLNIFLHWMVDESHVCAIETHDNGRVWEDSCVEFFLSPDGDDTYYNLECNCIGTALLGGGRLGTERPHLSLSKMPQIRRWSSLGYQPIRPDETLGPWQLSLVIPIECFFLHHLTSLSGREMRANFYKCGDLLPVPHFVSWNAIDTPSPSFHQPGFFGKIRFE